ncbi:PKD family protein [Chitinophaga skermanii]|uniref:PKD family protein n=1 Tax=Chitinophaga skermanii TaxID=331697 RepID=A0A327Q741_9BACT|nr:DUF5074 domain-containing protein [Chitinophaga skermanii]RAI99683.1 PKD family protein [Chitinophaga skermanii]
MKKNLLGWMALAALSVTAACNKDDNSPTIRPHITTEFAADTIEIGESVTLSPKLDIRDGVSYEWKVDNVPVSKDTAYTFKATARGSYRVVLTAANKAGRDSGVYSIFAPGPYDLGFALITEGWFGHGTGNLQFYSYKTNTLKDSVFLKENPSATLGANGNTLQYGTFFNNKIYMVVKAGGPVVAVDAFTMKESARVAAGGQYTSIVGIEANRGLIGGNAGLNEIDMTTMTVGKKINNVTGYIGNMLRANDKIFVLSQDSGIVVLKQNDYSIVKVMGKANYGFVTGTDGLIYAATGTKMWSINPYNLATDSVTLPFTVPSPWGVWRSVPMAASTKDAYIFLAPANGYQGGTKIYRYVKGNATSVTTPFITVPSGQFIYGTGIAYNAWKDELIVTTTNSGWGGSTNYLLFYNAKTGELKTDKTVTYSGWHFTAMPIMLQ